MRLNDLAQLRDDTPYNVRITVLNVQNDHLPKMTIILIVHDLLAFNDYMEGPGSSTIK